MWPYFLGLFYYFSSKSKKLYWIEKHLKQNRFTRHCSRNTKILRFIELKIFLSNSPLKKQGQIWPGQWEIGLREKLRLTSCYQTRVFVKTVYFCFAKQQNIKKLLLPHEIFNLFCVHSLYALCPLYALVNSKALCPIYTLCLSTVLCSLYSPLRGPIYWKIPP